MIIPEYIVMGLMSLIFITSVLFDGRTMWSRWPLEPKTAENVIREVDLS